MYSRLLIVCNDSWNFNFEKNIHKIKGNEAPRYRMAESCTTVTEKEKSYVDNNYIQGPVFRIRAVSIFFCSLNRSGAVPFRKMVFIFVIALDGRT